MKNNDIPLPKKITGITENDVMLNNKKIMFLCLKKWHESQKTSSDSTGLGRTRQKPDLNYFLQTETWTWFFNITLRKFRIAQTCLHDLGADKMTLQVLMWSWEMMNILNSATTTLLLVEKLSKMNCTYFGQSINKN